MNFRKGMGTIGIESSARFPSLWPAFFNLYLSKAISKSILKIPMEFRKNAFLKATRAKVHKAIGVPLFTMTT